MVQWYGCLVVAQETRVRFPLEPQTSRVINLRLMGSKPSIDYSVEGTVEGSMSGRTEGGNKLTVRIQS